MMDTVGRSWYSPWTLTGASTSLSEASISAMGPPRVAGLLAVGHPKDEVERGPCCGAGNAAPGGPGRTGVGAGVGGCRGSRCATITAPGGRSELQGKQKGLGADAWVRCCAVVAAIGGPAAASGAMSKLRSSTALKTQEGHQEKGTVFESWVQAHFQVDKHPYFIAA